MSEGQTLTLAFLELAPAAAADVLQKLTADQAAAFLETVPTRLAAPALSAMKQWNAARCLEQLSAPRAAAALRQIPFHEAAGLIRLIAPTHREALLEELPAAFAARLQRALQYLPDQVGAWADTQVPILRSDETVRDALRAMRESTVAVSHVFLEDRDTGRFAGLLGTRDLLGAVPGVTLAELPILRMEPIDNRQPLRTIAADRRWDEALYLPIVGRRRNVLGGLSRSALRRALRDTRAGDHAMGHTLLGQLIGALLITCAGLYKLGLGQHRAPPILPGGNAGER